FRLLGEVTRRFLNGISNLLHLVIDRWHLSSLCGPGVFGGPVREPPLGPTLLKTPRVAAAGAQTAHGLVRERAQRAAAVRDDLAIGRQLGQPTLQLLERDRPRALDVTRLELLP